jgi:DNA-binding NtrC family response regulator
MPEISRVLICDDDCLFHETVKYSFQKNIQFVSAMDGDEALRLLKEGRFDLLLLDLQMRTPREGLAYIKRFKACDPHMSVIITTGTKDFGVLREVLRLGADDYILKGIEHADLVQVISRSVERTIQKRNLVSCNEQLGVETREPNNRPELIGDSQPIQALLKRILKARESFGNVLITGETGTGKEVVARLLLKAKQVGTEPFVAIDSSTIQSTMAESILFGHERGAFTGADRFQKGVFEEADGGVVYFDEIANMPMEIQCKLLRVLQEKEVRRLGSKKVLQLNFRVICATNQDLDKLVSLGLFKEDLLQRLNVIPLKVPPLRHRKGDVTTLMEYFIGKNCLNGRKLSFKPETMDCLLSYDWPGNVRELFNLTTFLLEMSEQDEISLADLPAKILGKSPEVESPKDQTMPREKPLDSFRLETARFEKLLLENALKTCQGNVREASNLLDLDRSHLYTKLRDHGLLAVRTSS